MQMVEMEMNLDHQWESNETPIKTRSIGLVDHLGNLTSEKYGDEEQIEKITMNYKKNYVPTYLHSWTKFGMIEDNSLLLLSDLQLKSTVSNFDNDQELFTCGEIIVWIGTFDNSSLQKILVPVFVSDSMEKVKTEIKSQRQFTDIELKSSVLDHNEKPTEKNWTEGRSLTSEDTVFSSELFESNRVILVKVNSLSQTLFSKNSMQIDR